MAQSTIYYIASYVLRLRSYPIHSLRRSAWVRGSGPNQIPRPVGGDLGAGHRTRLLIAHGTQAPQPTLGPSGDAYPWIDGARDARRTGCGVLL